MSASVWSGLHCKHWFEGCLGTSCCRCRYAGDDDQQCYGYIGAAPCWKAVSE